MPELAIDPIGKCHLLFDNSGAPIGTQGDCTSNKLWQASDLIDKEKEWLIFEDNLNYTDDFGQFTNIEMRPFPIPVQSNDVIFLSIGLEGPADKFSKLKLAIVNEQEERVITFSRIISVDSSDLPLSLDGITTGQSYRIYYALSDAENSNYFTGYGDFFVCDQPLVIDYAECL